MASRTRTRTACPRCGAASVPIVYGLPGSELFEAADRGEIVLGGCSIFIGGDPQPTRACRGVDCGLEFRSGDARLDRI